MSSLQLFFFGAPRVERDKQAVRIRRRKGMALLAYLALTGRTHSREALATLLWPEFDHSRALSNLRRELSRLKNNTDDDFFLADRNQLALNLEAAYTVDVERFQSLLASVGEHNHFPAQPCEACLSALTEAVALYADHFLAGFNLPDAPGFDEWQFFQRESLRQTMSDALQQLVEWHSQQAEYGEAITYARRWLALDPLHEPVHRTLMALYARGGQQAAALRQYEEAVRLLEEELGVPPEPATEELYEAIRTRQFPRTPAEPVVAGVLPQATPTPAERYLLEEQLAVGGQAEVFRGRDRVTGEPVIVKRLRPELLTDEEGVARFTREGEALRQLKHPNIVHILDTFEEEGQQCIVMEYVPGGTLRELLDQGDPLPLPRVLAIALELADALSRAHHLGIIHRDLKPENVLLAADGAPRLTDFGVAGVEAADARLTQTGAILGSPAYMSPEALRGEPLTEQGDIWSFGVLLFEMLTGRRPFEGEQITQVLVNILHEPAPELTALQPEVPATLGDLVRAMLVKDREGRVASMRQVASALEAIRAGRSPVGLTPVSAEVAANQPGAGVATPPAQIQVSADAPIVPVVNLPRQATSFVGREQELDTLLSLLTDPEVRLVSVTGIGGAGKTRLSLVAAERLASASPPPFADGIVFVPLAPLDDSTQIVPAVANALNLPLVGEGDRPRQQLLESLHEKRMLLLLDNAEHLLDETGLRLVADLLATAPAVTLLVTSRTRLNVQGEHLFPLQGMSLPETSYTDNSSEQPVDSLSDAVRLFRERARQIQTTFTVTKGTVATIEKICRLLDGMPLAIELAATWLGVLPVREIVAEIERSLDFLETDARDVPERQRSLRAAFNSSWQLLNREEQKSLQALSVFRGRASRQAAQAVASTSLRTLRTLADKSWIQFDGDHYQMHEMLRQYSWEKLQAKPDTWRQARERHAAYYANWMVEQEKEMRGSTQEEAFTAVAAAFANLHHAWQWLVARGQVATAVEQLLSGLYRYCEARARGYELLHLVEEGLRVAEANRSEHLRVALLTAKGAFYRTGYPVRHESYGTISPVAEEALREAWLLRQAVQATTASTSWDPLLAYLYGRIIDRQEGISRLRQLVSHFRQSGPSWELALTLHYLAQLLQIDPADRFEEGEELLTEALALFEAAGDVQESAYTMRALGQHHRLQEKLEAAISIWEEAQTALLEIGNWAVAADIDWQIGDAQLQLGRFELAFHHYRRTSNAYLQRGHKQFAGNPLSKESYEAARYGDLDHALQTRQQALTLAREVGDDFGEAWSTWEMGELQRLSGDLDAARLWFEQARNLFTKLQHETGLTFYYRGVGDIALAREKHLEAQQQFQVSLRHAQATDHKWALAYAWCGMARASLGLDHAEMARHHLLEALRHAQTTGDRGITLLVVGEVAALFMALGEMLRAVQLATFVADHPLSWREVKGRVRGLLAAVSELSRGQRAAVQRQVETWELRATVVQLIDELDRSGAVTAGASVSSLPVPPTPFVGREKELVEVRNLLVSTTGNRLLTLIGPGGIGKTRLALEAARQSRLAFPDGIFFVPLAPLSSPDQIGAAIADSLGFQLAGSATPEHQFVDFLSDKKMLLLLDNFEQIIEGATVVAEILQASPALRIIATSREALNLSLETVYPLSGLSVPGEEALAADVSRYDAVALLLQQLQRVRPGFEPNSEQLRHAARIVRLVAGMPLALVMAAGWFEILSVAEIADEISTNLNLLESTARDLPERQRSIRAVFDYSWGRLAAAEQQTFMKLSVFPGGFSRQAAQAVTGAKLPTLRALVNKSFLTLSDNGRFDIHELLRHYGLQYLKAAGEMEQTQAAHSAYFLDALRQREKDLKGKRQLEALVEVEADLENVRTAWRSAVEMEQVELLIDSHWSLHLAFHVTGRYHDAVQLFQPAWQKFSPASAEPPRPIWRFITPCLAYNAAYSGNATPTLRRDTEICLELAESEGEAFQEANCLLALSCYALFVEQDTGAAIPFLERCLDLFRNLSEHFSVALTLAWLGFAHGQHGELHLFRTFCQQSVELALETGNLVVASAAKHNLGFVTIAVGDYASAEGYCREALEIATQIGRLQTVALAQLHLGLLHLLRGEVEQARTWANKGLQIGRRINVEVTKSYAYAVLSVCASLSGDGELARRLSERSRALTASYYYRIVSDWAGAISDAAIGAQKRWEKSWQRTLSEAHHAQFPGMITWLMPVAAISAAHAQQPERAAELMALAFHHPQSAPGWMEQWPLLVDLRKNLRQELGEAQYQQAWERGRQLELDTIVTSLLS